MGSPSWRHFPGGPSAAGNLRDVGWIPGSGRCPWRGTWQPTLVFLPEESHGQRSLAGCGPRGRKVGHDCGDRARVLLAAALGLEPTARAQSPPCSPCSARGSLVLGSQLPVTGNPSGSRARPVQGAFESLPPSRAQALLTGWPLARWGCRGNTGARLRLPPTPCPKSKGRGAGRARP